MLPAWLAQAITLLLHVVVLLELFATTLRGCPLSTVCSKVLTCCLVPCTCAYLKAFRKTLCTSSRVGCTTPIRAALRHEVTNFVQLLLINNCTTRMHWLVVFFFKELQIWGYILYLISLHFRPNVTLTLSYCFCECFELSYHVCSLKANFGDTFLALL